ncbi:hypothetical protein SAMN02745975_02601 [Geosporobacter subterraneus DSM 17957]|uniref:Uncharacterized protein n=1 Tax=Geosporobacter subterraneus DSM 17957 TaxID=1121919 RepID=A0A1M6L6N2_9FIRM|nr:hypothetical protein [Geosporobacter subterraneus]SHJ66850.1 hypothetical protein SAMN02745975_02601 [Geosporobacter subterraneus DSM 17957]
MYDTGLFNELVITVIRGLLIPLVPVIAAYLIALIKKKTEDINNQLKDAQLHKYADMTENIINTAVTAVYQTYIDDILKKRGVLTDEEMKTAFNFIKENSVKIISQILMEELSKKYTALDKWIENMIVCSLNPQMLKDNNLAEKLEWRV